MGTSEPHRFDEGFDAGQGDGVLNRRGRGIATALAAVSVVAGVAIAATLADGRTASQADTHDGGAWLLNRDDGAIGHMDRRSQELTGSIRIGEPRTGFDVDQARGVVLVHDASTATATLVDDRSYSASASIEAPEDLALHAVNDGMVAFSADPIAARRLDLSDLNELTSVTDVPVILRGDGPGLGIVDRLGRPVIADQDGTLQSEQADGEILTTELPELTARPTQLTRVGDTTVLLTESGELRTSASPAEILDPPDVDRAGDWVLQQPAPSGTTVTAIDPDGRVVRVDLADGTITEVGELEGGLPLAPIVHEGCTYAVSTQPATLTRLCGDDVLQTPLDGGSGSTGELRLRLVNGWIWINDVNAGTGWVIDAESELVRIDDWDVALAQDQSESDELEVTDGPADEQRENPDEANVVGELEDFDLTGPNVAPVARRDQAATREGRPVVVDVLANDTDENGDVLLVEAVDNRSASDAVVEVSGDRTAVQVVPAAGFTGTVRFSYTVSDGRGGRDSAEATVDVTPRDAERNRAPEAVTDVATVRAGERVSLNVLTNDRDPDGDSLTLEEVSGDGVSITSTSDGSVTLTPDPDQEGRLELDYTVRDEYGATAAGRILLEVRLPESNRAPQARNDTAQSVTDNRIVLDVLANDSDPDGDRLIVQSQPELLLGPDGVDPFVSLDARGRLDFEADQPGTYVLLYTISDGSLPDSALIRIEVRPRDENRPPVAVRDDLTVPVGSSRIVPALRNDFDPDGDVISIVDWRGADGLNIQEVEGDRFRVTALPNAPAISTFHYTISDGVNEPVTAVVVVHTVDQEQAPPPPVANPDEVEVRAGQVSELAVLDDDYDPSGGQLDIVGVTDPDGASAGISSDAQRVVLEVPDTTTRGFTMGYEIENENGDRASTTVQVRVVPDDDANRAPIAGTDIARTIEGREVVIDVLANDRDPDGDAIDIEGIARQPADGSASVLEDGRLRYVPDRGFTGTDRLAYTVRDSRGLRATGEVLVGVSPPWPENRPPQAQDDTASAVAGDGRLPIDVLTNDVDPDGDPLTIVSADQPRMGQVSVATDGSSLVYTAPDEIDAQESEVAFRYRVDDGRGGQDDAIVTVTVVSEASLTPPVATDDRAGPVQAGELVTIDVLENDRAPGGSVDDLEVSVTDPTLSVVDGRVQLTAPDRTTSYRYTITNAGGLSDSATIDVAVVENRPPVVEPLEAETPHDQPITLELTDQASDPDDDELFFTCCDTVRGGTVTVLSEDATSLTVEFAPNPEAAGRAGFSYDVDDQNDHQIAGSVSIEVLPPTAPPPVAGDTDVEVEAGGTRSVDLGSLVEHEGDRQELSYSGGATSGPVEVERSGGTLRLTAPRTATGATGETSYTVTDPAGQSDSGTISITVIPTSVPLPEARTDTGRTTQGEPVVIPVLDNDVGSGLRVVAAGGSSEVNAERADGDTAVRLRPTADFFGTTSASYTIRDEFDDPDREVTGRIELTVIGRPGTPSAPSATADSRQATLTWSSPASNGAPIEGYEVEHDQGGVQTLEPTSTYTWSSLTNGTAYRFRVRATNEAGFGEWSPWSSEVVPNEVPGRPGAPQVRFGDGELEVEWQRPDNDGSPITTYVLEIGGATTGVREVSATGSDTQRYVWDGLTNGANHTFRVKAVNAADEAGGDFSSWSEPENPLTQPDAPSRPTLENGPNYLDVSWSRPDDGGDAIQEYEIQIDSSNGSTLRVSGANTTNYRWGDLTNGEDHTFRVRAWNRDSRGGEWSSFSAPGRACDVPAAPGAPGASRGDQSAEVTWNAPSANGCDITGYEVTFDGGSSVRSAGASARSLTIDGLTNGTEYRFQVRAINEMGSGTWSGNSSSVTPAGPPTTPRISRVEATDVEELTVGWARAEPNGSAITGYEWRKNSGPARDAGDTTSIVDRDGLTATNEYCYQVRAVNDVGPGDWSTSACAVAEGRPGAPSSFSIDDRQETSLRWRWAPPGSDGGSAITRYEVDRGRNGNNLISESASTRTHTWGGLDPGTTYDIRIRACNRHGCSGWANANGTTLTPPSPSISIRYGASSTVDGCSASTCKRIEVSARDFSPNTNYTVVCHDSRDPNYYQYSITTDGNGDSNSSTCRNGEVDINVWVTINSVRSNTISQ